MSETEAMAEDRHLDRCRQAYEAFSDGDLERMLTLFDPEIDVYVAPPNFESGRYHGREEYRRLLERWGSAWTEMRIEIDEIGSSGEWILARVTYRGKVAGAEAVVEQPSWEASRWIDGTCRSYEVYWDREAGEGAFARLAASD